jgi:acetyltransferase
MTTAAEVAGAIIPILRAAGKPVVVALMGEDLIVHAARLLRQARVPDYRFPERAAMAMGVLWRRAQLLVSLPPLVPQRVEGVPAEKVDGILRGARRGVDGFVDSSIAARVVSACGVETPAQVLAATAAEAVAAARSVGFPIALKIASADVPHKTDSGGVRLGLTSADEVGPAFDQMLASVAAAHPAARLSGAVVQPMVGGGQEVILGSVRDEQFGPLVMFGAGGVEVESMRDVAFGLAPLSRGEAEAMVDSTYAGRRLKGNRAAAPADREAVVQSVLRVAQLAVDRPDIAEIEVNPLRVFEAGKGVCALDVRLRLA